MLQGREPARRATRATQKVREDEVTRSKSKGKGKANVDDEVKEEARAERLRKVKAEIAVLQDIVNQLES
jgi:Asp-tRNA(Asn)/Glu-tRNA(Gln) amidotransferase C subunit